MDDPSSGNRKIVPRCVLTIETYFATCARGLEKVLAQELEALAATHVETGRGGVHFSGDLTLLYRANLWLRTAVRVLRPILETEVTTPESLYEAVRSLDWSQYLTPAQTIAVDANVRDSQITHSKYAALKTKDAICDWFVERQGRRPSVNVHEPMVGLNLHISANHAVLSLDSSGESLHKRGYRTALHRAAMNEALAAGLLLLSQWHCNLPFLDPLCGSGTIPIEALWMAQRRPPALTRKRFGFQGWLDFDKSIWLDIRDDARNQVLSAIPAPIQGSDIRSDVIQMANQNARAAGCGHLLSFAVKDVAKIKPPSHAENGVILCNPPYGERIGEEKDLIGLYRTLGKVFGDQFSGWQAYVFTGNGKLARQIRLPVQQRWDLFNGRIPCQLLHYDLSN